jgi:hypothetical protein
MTTLLTLVVLLSTTVLTAVCVMLVLHPDYEDGIVGRAALAGISMVAFSRWAGIVFEEVTVHRPFSALLWGALAVFFARHAYRFLSGRRRVGNEWRAPRRSAVGGKKC